MSLSDHLFWENDKSEAIKFLKFGLSAIDTGRLWDAQKFFQTAIFLTDTRDQRKIQYITFVAAEAFFAINRPTKAFIFYQTLSHHATPITVGTNTQCESSIVDIINSISETERRQLITALVQVEKQTSTGQLYLAEQVANAFKGLPNAKVYQITESNNQGVRVDVFTNQTIAKQLTMQDTPCTIYIKNAGIIESVKTQQVRSMSNQIFPEGKFTGCNFGDHNSMTNYLGVVDKLNNIDDDAKDKLKESRKQIEDSQLTIDNKNKLVDYLNELSFELSKPKKEESKIRKIWSSIKKISPVVAAILSTAVSIAALL